MARFIGIDYGKIRVGIAVTDPLGLICSPLNTIPSNEVIPFLKDYTQKEYIAGIAIGMPRDLQNREKVMCMLVKKFTRLLNRYFPTIPLYHHDERFTSVLAQQSLLESSIKKKSRQNKKLLDAISASFILRSFLELHARGKSEKVNNPIYR